MSRALEMLERLMAAGSPDDCCEELDAELSRVTTLEDLRELLAASSVLLHAAARAGSWQAPDLARGVAALEGLRGPELESIVLAVGTGGREVLTRWCREDGRRRLPRALLLDCESAMVRGLPADVPQVAIDAFPAGDGPLPTSQCELMRSAYRTGAGAGGPPPALAEIILATRAKRSIIHIVVSLEDPWIAAIPDLALDLRALLGHVRSRIVLHLITRPAPKLRGAFLSALADIEQARPVDEVFFVSGGAAQVAERVGDMVHLADEAPEILAGLLESHRGGAFSSYGVAAVVLREDDSPSIRLRVIDDALAAATPGWLPGGLPLPEQVRERTYLVHDPACPPPDEAWRLCPEIQPLPVPGATMKLCRIQRGLSLRDARLS